jgi:DNA (cytosine-5)-methyltransferase 1
LVAHVFDDASGPFDIVRNNRINPHWIIKVTRADKAEVKRRAAIGIPAFEAVSNHGVWDQSEEDSFPGYPDGVPYASPPRTRYQARARQGIAEDADVELHYTARFSEGVIERLVTPPSACVARPKLFSLLSC